MQKSEFAKLLVSIADLYQFRLTADCLDWYWRTLGELDADAFKRAITEHLSDTDRGKWMPKPAEILHFYVHPRCKSCESIGVIVCDGDRIMPWSLRDEVEGGLQPEVCPECRGRNRIETPGLPEVIFGGG
jgi:hypothetical protein